MGADGVDVGIDHILADVAPDAASGSRNGSPSDHPLVKGSFTLSSGQATTAPPTTTSRGNDETCTEEGKDPYASGQNVQCCTGLQSCLGDWSGQLALPLQGIVRVTGFLLGPETVYCQSPRPPP